MVRTNLRFRERLTESDRRRPIPLMGPVLELYKKRYDRIAFVLVITGVEIIDFYDWAEKDDWARRLWVNSLGKWQPFRGEIAALNGDTKQTLDRILSRLSNQG